MVTTRARTTGDAAGKRGGQAMNATEFSATDELLLATSRPDGSWRTRPVWFVVVDASFYVRSAFGKGSLWYRAAERDRHLLVVVDGAMVPAWVEFVADEGLKCRISNAYLAKYALRWPGPAQTMVDACASETTMRLTCRD
jgi:hypothetical protein